MPNDIINLDYESFSEVDLKKHGLDRYSSHPSTEIIMAAWSVNGAKTKYWDIAPGRRPPAELKEALADPDVIKWAFNAQFERIMTQRVWGIDTPYSSWRCTMVLAYMMGFVGDLAGVGRAMGLPSDKLKMAEGKKLIQLFCKPQKVTKTNPNVRRTPRTDPDLWRTFGAYNVQDVEAEKAIQSRLIQFPVPEFEWDLYAVDQEIMDRGVFINQHHAIAALNLAEQRKPRIMDQMKALTELSNPGSTAQLLPWVKDRGYPFDDMQANSVKKALREQPGNGMEQDATDALRMRQASSKSSLAKYNTMLDAVGDDGRFRYSLQFHGAQRTGRWAGRRLQTHNLPRTPKIIEDVENLQYANELIQQEDLDGLELFVGEPMDALVGTIRSSFVPAPGKKFVVADLSSIESVGIGWFTDCKWFMDNLAAGRDLYRAFAAEWLQIPYEDTKPHRNKAKPATLGAGYRLGGGDEMPDGKKTGLWGYGENMGVMLTKEEAHSSVQTFRELCPEIVETWYALERAVFKCIRTKQTQTVKYVRIEWRKPFLCIVLPSGRRMFYYQPQIVNRKMPGRDGKEGYMKEQFTYMGKPQNGNGWVRIYSHGGKLIENCVTSDTKVLTDRGVKRIIDVLPDDLLWDGVEWVRHGGLIEQGVQEVGQWLGVELTANHKILVSNKWLPAGEMDSNTTESALKSARSSAISRYLSLIPENPGEHGCSAGAEKNYPCVQTRSTRGEQTGAQNAPCTTGIKRKTSNRSSKTESFGLYGRTAYPESSHGAEIQNPQHIRTTENGGSTFTSSGSMTERVSLPTSSQNFPTGRTKDSTLTVETTRPAISPETFGSSLALKTHGTLAPEHSLNTRAFGTTSLNSKNDSCPTSTPGLCTTTQHSEKQESRSWRYTGQKPVYDIVNAGPRHRFTILTDAGPVIVHNCIQALCRDILVNGIKGAEQNQMPVVMHIHDEIVTEVDEWRDDLNADKLVKIMSQPIDWAPGIPLGAAGWEGYFYRKD